MSLTPEQRSRVDEIKASVRAADTVFERIAAYNAYNTTVDGMALSLWALHELRDEEGQDEQQIDES
jgi:hypothetical protein